jgi:hypothetical protein
MTVLATPVQNWAVRMMNSLAVRGYPTLDLRQEPGPQMVPIGQLVAFASSTFEGGAHTWNAIGDHLQALKPMGADTIALLTHRDKIDIYVGRAESEISLSGAHEYFTGMEFWLRRLTELLPEVQVSDKDKAAIAKLSGTLAGALVPAAGAVLSKVLMALYEASGPGSCVTIHPVTGGDGAFATDWANADLTSVPYEGIGNRNWLWNIQTTTVTPAKTKDDIRHHEPLIDPQGFASLVASVTG